MFLNTAVWIKVMLAILIAFMVSFALTPVVKILAQKVGAMDVPGEARRVHDHPIPRMGGLAIFLGFIVSMLLFVDITQEVRGILLGSIIIVITGVIDDIISLRAWTKFLIQILSAVIAVLHGVVITVVSIAIMPGFLRRFTTDESLVASGITYSTIVFLFATINMAALAFEKMFQAVGRMKVTMVALVFGCACNILLDPVLIFGLGPVPAMGIAGAALATGIGQLLSLCVYLFVYLRTELPVRLSRSGLHPDVALDGKLYAIGVPAILNLALPSLLVTFLNSLLAGFSQSNVVILGIYYKLQTFLYLPANGIVQGMRPLIGYNYGAREHARVKKLYELTLFMSIAIMALGTVICLLASGQLIGLFTSNPDTIAAGAKALRIICIGFVVSAVSTTSSGALEGLGKGVPSLVISLCRYVVFIMPLAAVLCGRLGPDGVWHAFWITEVLTALVAYPVYHRAAARH